MSVVSVVFADDVDAVEDEVPVLDDEELLDVEALVVLALVVVFFFAVDCFAAPPPGFARQKALTLEPFERTWAAT